MSKIFRKASVKTAHSTVEPGGASTRQVTGLVSWEGLGKGTSIVTPVKIWVEVGVGDEVTVGVPVTVRLRVGVGVEVLVKVAVGD